MLNLTTLRSLPGNGPALGTMHSHKLPGDSDVPPVKRKPKFRTPPIEYLQIFFQEPKKAEFQTQSP